MRFQSAKQPRTRVRLASYSTSYAYTHLGQLWQGPLAGGSTQYQYLYCSSSQPHQLTGLNGTSATCSNKTGQGYASSYDGFGNVTSRTFSGTTGTLTYDLLDHLTQWYAGSTNQEQYLYDASGQRMLRRFTNSNGTTILTYPFGIEEHQYSGSGSNQWNVYYYFLAGRLVGSLDGNGTQFYLVDALGSLVSDFNNAAGGAALKGNQLFGPYGVNRYFAGNINTAKGFIGQYNDGTGLDYLNAWYYDPVVGVFLSADTVQGNQQAMNPYAYVNGNPETHSDPSGHDDPGILSQLLQNPWLMAAAATMVSPEGAAAWFLIAGSIALMQAPSGSHHGSANGPQPVPAPTPTPSTDTNGAMCRTSRKKHCTRRENYPVRNR